MQLPNLYTLPNDLYDYYGSSGTQLRLDDDGLATGLTICATADAILGATSVNVTPLQSPLLKGSILVFAGAGMVQSLEVTLSAIAKVGATSLTVNALLAPVDNGSTAQDNGINLATALRLTKACQFGTSQVKLYCCSRYDDSQLYANSTENGSVKRWATALGGRWLGRRRSQGCPKSIELDADESLDEMKAVKNNGLNIEDIGTRTAGWPFWSNTTIDLRYNYAKVRVESLTSEATPTVYGQFVDWNSLFFAGEY